MPFAVFHQRRKKKGKLIIMVWYDIKPSIVCVMSMTVGDPKFNEAVAAAGAAAADSLSYIPPGSTTTYPPPL